ncbi:MAG: hypothetical protein RIS76_3905, partial [Verrucomicrobiota bacterium]
RGIIRESVAISIVCGWSRIQETRRRDSVWVEYWPSKATMRRQWFI